MPREPDPPVLTRTDLDFGQIGHLMNACDPSKAAPPTSAAVLEALLTSDEVGLAVLDAGLRFVRVNARFARAQGLPPDSYVGRRPMDVFPGSDSERYLPALRRALAGEVVRGVDMPVAPGIRESVCVDTCAPISTDGAVTGVLLIARGVTEREERSRHHQSARRLQFLQAVSEIGLSGATLTEVLDEITRLLRQTIGADTAVVLLPDTRRVLRARAAAGLTEADVADIAVPWGEGVAGVVAATGRPVRLDDGAGPSGLSGYLRTHQLKSFVAVPLLLDDRVTGVLNMASRRSRAFTEDDVALLTAVAGRVALVVDRAAHVEQQREIAEVLQRSLLPDRLPQDVDIEVAARYQPAGRGLAVGGDWYDAVRMPSGAVGFVVGDVMGHGIRAAALMGRLRTSFAAALTAGVGVEAALVQLNALVNDLDPEALTTLAVIVLEPGDGSLHCTVAGHPPPLLRRPDGTVRVLDNAAGPALGVQQTPVFPWMVDRLEPGGAILLYTDGLIERRGHKLDLGLERAAMSLAAASGSAEDSADKVLKEVAGELGSEPNDDITVLVAHRLAAPEYRLELATDTASDLPSIRRRLREWLTVAGATGPQIDDITLAVTEALADAVKHDNGGETRLTLSQRNGSVEATIHTPGSTPAERVDLDHARGLLLMEALTDLLVIDTAHGTRVRLTRKIGKTGDGSALPP